jgi:protein-tyrosine phosphatase
MGSMLIVDGSDVCRAPIVAFGLRSVFGATWLADEQVTSAGITAEPGATMCESASARLGYSGHAIAFFGTHRAVRLTKAAVLGADLVLTAERSQRSAVVRLAPGTQALVFTWKEALVLADALVDRRRSGRLSAPAALPALALALHGARGTVPLIEPPVRTGPFHWRRAAESDPLTVASGHDGAAEHRRVTQESADVAAALGLRLSALVRAAAPEVFLPDTGRAARRLRRTA